MPKKTAPPKQTDFPPIVFEPLQCSTCRHNGYDGSCSAYPQGIPLEIRGEFISHRVPQPGDNGIRWEAAPPEVTGGPVRFVRILMAVTGKGWDTVGAVWVSKDGKAAGFHPAPAYMVADETMHWITLLRRSWQNGWKPNDVMAALPEYGNGITVETGGEEAAPSLDALAQLLEPSVDPTVWRQATSLTVRPVQGST